MKKTYKKLIVYGLGAATVGGIVTGITVPVVMASNKINILNPLPGITENTKILKNGQGVSGDAKDVINDVKSAGIEDKTLLHKTEYATAFYLYKKEQVASLKYQVLDLRYAQFQQLNTMFKSLASNLYEWDDKAKELKHVEEITLKDKDEKDVKIKLSDSDSQSTIDFDNLLMKDEGSKWIPDYEQYQNIYDELKALFEQSKKVLDNEAHDKDANKSKIDRVTTVLKSFIDKWEKEDTGLKSRIERLGKDFAISDYDDSNFSSRFPKVLKPVGELKGKDGDWSGTGIYATQSKIFMDQRRSFIENYKTKEEAEGEWAKELTKKYNGATSEREAIESMVYNVVKTSAFARKQFIVNSNFTVDHLLSGVYNEIIGYVAKDSFSYDGTTGLQYDSAKIGDKIETSISKKDLTKTANTYSLKRDSKTFFFGTKSLIIDLINSEENELPPVFENRNMMKLNNAVIGYKQGATLLEGWTLTKDMVKNMLYVRKDYDGTTHVNGDYFNKVFQPNEDWITNELISKYTETKDSTQFKMGNLGYMDGLTATNMADGFGLGMLAAYDELVNDGSTPDKQRWFKDQVVTERKDLLTDISTELVKAFLDAAKALGLAALDEKAAQMSEAFFTKENQTKIDKFIDGLSDDQIKQYFGIAIRNVFNENIEDVPQDGMSQVFRITDKDTAKKQGWGIYAFYAPAYGLHLVKVDVKAFNAKKNIKDDMQKAADDQDAKSSSTDYASLYTSGYQLINQIDTLLKDDAYKTYLNKYFKDNYDYKPVYSSVSEDINKLTQSLIESQNIDRVSKTKWENFTNYLIKEFDAGLIDQSLAMDPEVIYTAVRKMGGK